MMNKEEHNEDKIIEAEEYQYKMANNIGDCDSCGDEYKITAYTRGLCQHCQKRDDRIEREDY